MKQRHQLLLLSILMLGLLAAGCSRAAATRGWAPPVVSGSDTVLMTTAKGKLTAIGISSNELAWRFPSCWQIGDKGARSLKGIYGPPVVAKNGTIFVGDYGGYIYAFNAGDSNCGSGEKHGVGSVKLKGPIIGGVALDSSGNTLYVTSGESLYSLKAADVISRIKDGKAEAPISEVFKTGADIWGAPVLVSGNVLISSLDGNLYAIDTSSGKEVWRFNAGRGLASTPVVSNGLALVGGFDDKLHGIDASSGKERWSAPASNWVWSSPAIDGGRAYFGDFDGKIYAIDVTSGTQAWTLALGKGSIRGAPAFARNVLVAATEDGWLVGIDPSTQQVRWEKQIDTPVYSDLLVQGNNVFITPKGCVTSAETSEKVYYAGVDPLTGDLRTASGVC